MAESIFHHIQIVANIFQVVAIYMYRKT